MANSLFNLSNIDGSNGFVIQGTEDYSVDAFSNAGDINNDGIDDFIVSTFFDDTTSKSYVVFGDREIGNDGSFEPSTLDGSNGFVINSIEEGDSFGRSVSNAGDVNGDGIDDLIIGATGTYNFSDGTGGEGQSYVVFGGAELGSDGNLELNSLDGSNGFVINGIEAGDRSGFAVSNAGDVNGDGIDDIIIGAPNAAGELSYDAYGDSTKNGESYVVFGGSEVSSNGSLELSSLDGSNGFIINGTDGVFTEDDSYAYGLQSQRFGSSVSSAGDLNGDGFDDIAIGAPGSFDFYSRSGASGETFVIFGSTEVGSDGNVDLNSLDGSNGFFLNGTSDYFGETVSSGGDINGDGFDELFIGSAFNFNARGFLSGLGLGYVVFGNNEVGGNGSVDPNALDSSNGFTIESDETLALLGESVSNAGDVNGDGFEDLIIGAPRAGGYYYTTPYGYTYSYPFPGPGASYIIFGDSEVGSGGTIAVENLDGNNGVALEGIDNFDSLGREVTGAGDINNDGIDDLIVAAPGADPNEINSAGEGYIVFGNAAPQLDLNGEAGIDFTTTFTGSPLLLVDRNNLILTDSNSNTLSQATVVLTNPLNGNNEILAADTTGTAITAAYDLATGTLSLTGEDSLANYRQVLKTLTYNNTAEVLDTTNRIIEFTLDDGAAFNNTSTIATTTIDLDAVPNFSGSGGQSTFTINAGDGEITIADFGGVGTGIRPTAAVVEEVDTLQFLGSQLTADNLILTQQENDLVITFEGVEDTTVILSDFDLEQLDNLPSGIGNILFDRQQEITDSFDVLDIQQVRSRVFNRDTVTFLNDLHNTLQGFNNSNDVINGQGRRDILLGRSGNDVLRGNGGDDILLDGGAGKDRLDGGLGNDGLFGGAGADEFVLRKGEGTDTIFDFEVGFDRLMLASGLEFEQLTIASNNGRAEISLSETNEVLAVLIGVNASNLDLASFS